jgi:TIR domain
VHVLDFQGQALQSCGKLDPQHHAGATTTIFPEALSSHTLGRGSLTKRSAQPTSPGVVQMADGIFVCYRRDDTAPTAGRLVDKLAGKYKPDQIFQDVPGIEPGIDWQKEIEKRIAVTKVMLVIIGPRWLAVRNENGDLRLTLVDDWVRREIEAALACDIRMIPVLVGGAKMPKEAELPPSIAALHKLQKFDLLDEHFTVQVQKLIDHLGDVVPPRPTYYRRRQVSWPHFLNNVLSTPVFIAVIIIIAAGRVYDWFLFILVVAGLFVFVARVLTNKVVQTVKISNDTIMLHGLLRWPRFRTPIHRITAAHLSTRSNFSGGEVYLVAGKLGIEIVMDNGKYVFIGTEDRTGLQTAILEGIESSKRALTFRG